MSRNMERGLNIISFDFEINHYRKTTKRLFKYERVKNYEKFKRYLKPEFDKYRIFKEKH